MKINTVSVLLTYYREKYHLSQIQLCDGICSITTYSRIEQGYREVEFFDEPDSGRADRKTCFGI